MKLRIPSKTVEACDVCKRQTSNGILTRCVICRREYCHCCEAIICGCIHQPDVCKECAKSETVHAVVAKFVKPLMRVLKQRDAALRRCKGKP